VISRNFFNRISQAIVRHSDYRRVIISLFKEESPYRDIISFGGIKAEVADQLRTIELPKSWYNGVFERGIKIGRISYYIPHTMKNILNQEATIYGKGPPPDDSDSWHPEDNLFVRMRDEKGEFVGVISVDDSKSGLHPTDETVRPLEIFASLIVQIIILKKEQRQRKLLEEQLVQARKMESIGTLAGGVAHDFNNILGIMLGNIELVISDFPRGHQGQINLQEAMTAGLRAKYLIHQLLSFSRPTDQRRQTLVMKPVVEESLKLMRSILPANIEIKSELDDRVRPILSDATQIHQVIINLCTNAAHAMAENGGQIQIRLVEKDLDKNGLGKSQELMPGRYVMLEVCDTGHGIAPNHLSRIFDPYYSTKEVDKGTGMGLSVVYGIVKSAGGEIVVESQPENGTTFKLFFPVVKAEPLEEKEEIEEIPMGRGRILLVDDEPALTKLGCQMLTRLGYETKAFNHPVEALQWFKAHPDAIDLVMTDMTMPHLSGAQMIEKIKQLRPDLPVVLCTGFNEYIDESGANDLGVDAFVMKPIILRELAQTIHKTIN
jgi:signal transduction histidine kinase/CheY-like chemotaxis protein